LGQKEIAMFDELLSKLQPHDLIPVLAIVLGVCAGVVIAITAIIVGSVRHFRERELAEKMIHDLLERGLPTDEIERLVRAAGPQSEAERLVRAASAKRS
jgi:hypothetical protein